MNCTAFTTSVGTSAFLGERTSVAKCDVARRPFTGVRMMAEDDSEPKPKRGLRLPVLWGKPKSKSDGEENTNFATTATRGLALVVEDLRKNLPEVAGVGRQDVTGFMKPQFGEPGYKPQAYETVKYSELGISSFSDDKNYVSKVGGIDAVKKAAKDALAGKKASDIKAAVLKADPVVKEEPKEYPLPDYLQPLPEDTPRKGMTWKNYVGR